MIASPLQTGGHPAPSTPRTLPVAYCGTMYPTNNHTVVVGPTNEHDSERQSPHRIAIVDTRFVESSPRCKVETCTPPPSHALFWFGRPTGRILRRAGFLQQLGCPSTRIYCCVYYICPSVYLSTQCRLTFMPTREGGRGMSSALIACAKLCR